MTSGRLNPNSSTRKVSNRTSRPTPAKDGFIVSDAPIKEQHRKFLLNLRDKGGDEYLVNYETFKEFVSLPCHYCGQSGTRKIKTRSVAYSNGIDRVDSNRGYFRDNIVPCCWMCNRLKMRSSVEDLLNHALRIVRHQNLM